MGPVAAVNPTLNGDDIESVQFHLITGKAMLVRKTFIGLALAGLSAGALAQQSSQLSNQASISLKTDIFGRPYVNESGLEVFYQADPFAPLPQIEQWRAAQRRAEAAAATAGKSTGSAGSRG